MQNKRKSETLFAPIFGSSSFDLEEFAYFFFLSKKIRRIENKSMCDPFKGNFSPILSGQTKSLSPWSGVSCAAGGSISISSSDEVGSCDSSPSKSRLKRDRVRYDIQILACSWSMAMFLFLFSDLLVYPMWKAGISGIWNKDGSFESQMCFATRLKTSFALVSLNPPSLNSKSSRRIIGDRCNKLSLSFGLQQKRGSRPNFSLRTSPSSSTISARVLMITVRSVRRENWKRHQILVQNRNLCITVNKWEGNDYRRKRPTNFSTLTRSSTLLENPRIVQELYLAFHNNYKP